MKSFILVIALINLSACSFDSNKDNYSLKNSENSDVGNSYDIKVGKNISSFVDENRIF